MSDIVPSVAEVRGKFCARLREMRVARNWTAPALAKANGMEEVRYHRYERGDVEPTVTLVVQVCIVLGVAPNELFPDMPQLGTTPGAGCPLARTS